MPKMKPAPPALVEIFDIGFGGKGVGRVEGKIWFVPFVVPGERVRARPRRTRKDFVEAGLEAVELASPDRVEAPCRYFTRCGGCAYQHIAYERQLEIKRAQAESLLRRVGKLDCSVEAVRPSPMPLRYRNRITLHIRDGQAGFIGANPSEFVPVRRCEIASEAVNEKLAALWRRRMRDGHVTLREHDPREGFRQTNDGAAAILLELLSGLAGSGPRLVDAYCGSGFFSRALRDHFAEVVGIDWSVPAIETARALAQPHETYHLGDAAEHLRAELRGGDVLILDPPAEGLSADIPAIVHERRPSRILYVSCNPSTLARDLSRLRESYGVDRVTPVDMFPQTAEIECVAVLSPVSREA